MRTIPAASQLQPIRILIADLHPIFRVGLRRLLEEQPGFQLVGEAADAHEAVRQIAALRPDVVLLDIAMPLNGYDALRNAGSKERAPQVLLMSATIERIQVVEALQLGARGVFLKESAPEQLVKAITSVMAGEFWVGREHVSDLVGYLRDQASSRPAARTKFGLTPRELEVVGAVVTGSTNKDIAQRLKLSEDTVKHHLTRIFDKVGVFNRLELALLALDNDLVDRD